MNTVSIIALNLGLSSRGIRNVEIIDVMDYGNGIDVCFKEADGKVWGVLLIISCQKNGVSY